MTSLLHNNKASKPATLHTKAKPFVQAKLTVNEPGDIYEQEADAMADRVMRMSSTETIKQVLYQQQQTIPQCLLNYPKAPTVPTMTS